MKMILKTGLHPAALKRQQIICDFMNAKLLPDEVNSFINPPSLKSTQEKREGEKEPIHTGKKVVEGLLLKLTRVSQETELRKYYEDTFSGEANPCIQGKLLEHVREKRESFCDRLHPVKVELLEMATEQGLISLPDKVIRNILCQLLTKGKENRKAGSRSQSRIKYFFLGILLLTQPSSLNAGDKGVAGEVFPIIEEDLLEVIQNKLSALEKDGSLQSHQQHIQQQVEKGIRRPVPVKNLKTAQTASSALFDPSIIVPHDLKDHQGRVFQKAGTKVNPLTMRSLSKPLLFIDGDDQAQIEWALSEHKANQLVKIILTSGAPLDLSEKYNLSFYFDQDGVLTTKLGIKEVPSRVSQQGLYLLVESIPVIATDLGKDK